MKSAVVSCHIPVKLKKRLFDRATEDGVSVSRCVSDILAGYFKNDPKEDDLFRSKEELENALVRTANCENCKVFETVEGAKEYMRKVANEVSIRQTI
jgi:hypothetical protein